MTDTGTPPLACTLDFGDLAARLAWIRELMRTSLRSHTRRDLALELDFDPRAESDVREMVRKEQHCCAFLDFQIERAGDDLRLTITAPEEAREATDVLFAQFLDDRPSSVE